MSFFTQTKHFVTLSHPSHNQTAQLNIAYAIDKNYLKPCGVSLYSVASHNPHINIDCYIFTDDFDDFGFKDIINLYPNIRIHVYLLNTEYFDQLPTKYHLSTATYYRFAIADALKDKVQQCIYLDADVICQGALDELTTLQLNDHAVAAVVDPYFEGTYKVSIGLEFDQKYFNAGVLIINTNQWHELNVMQTFQEMIQAREYKYLDQDILNIILQQRILWLDSKFNDVTQGKNGVALLTHFVSSPKPWNMAASKNEVYLQYYYASPWKDFNLDSPKKARDCKVYAKKLWKQGLIFEAIKWYCQYLKKKIV